MRVKLITDSIQPNIALMKFRTWAGIRGHVAEIEIENPTHCLISCIWPKNKSQLIGICSPYPHAQIIGGGPGWDPSLLLPREIEQLPPDYSLFPKFKDSIGFVTAGCPRRCPFCVVPAQGGIRYVQHVNKFYRGGICRIMDDNILAMPEAFHETAKYLIDHGIRTRFEYLDIRFVNEEIAGILGDIKTTDYGFHFAYDITSSSFEAQARRNVEILKAAGIGNRRITFFIYLNSESEHDRRDACRRWAFIRSLGVEVFGMPNYENVRDPKLKGRMIRPGRWRGMTAEKVFGIDENNHNGHNGYICNTFMGV